MITIIAAVGKNNALGKNNDLLWHLPNDFKRFKALTSGHYIIMGRKTFESFPKPLPNRTHVIVTNQKNYAPEGCIVVNSIEKAMAICPENEDFFIIGGGEIYKQTIDIADVLDITRVHENFDAEVFFPEIDLDVWKIESSEFHEKDEKHQYDFSFDKYVKR